MATTASFKSFSLTRLSIKAPDRGDERLRPVHVPGKDEDHNRRGVDYAGENVLRRARAADRQTHHGQRGHHQKSDAAAEIAAIDGDEKLQRARTPGRQMRFAGRRSLAKETASGEQRGREQHQRRHETGEDRRRRGEENERAKSAANEADDE